MRRGVVLLNFQRELGNASSFRTASNKVPGVLEAIKRSLSKDIEKEQAVANANLSLMEELGGGPTGPDSSETVVGTAAVESREEVPRHVLEKRAKESSVGDSAIGASKRMKKTRSRGETKIRRPSDVLSTLQSSLKQRHNREVIQSQYDELEPPPAIVALAQKVINPSLLKAANMMRAESFAVNAIRVLPQEKWRVGANAEHRTQVLEQEVGIIGRMNPTSRMKTCRHKVEDLCCNEVDWEGKVASFTKVTRPYGSDPALAALFRKTPQRYLRFLMHSTPNASNSTLTQQEALHLVGQLAGFDPALLSGQAPVESNAVSTTICALDLHPWLQKEKDAGKLSIKKDVLCRLFRVNESSHSPSLKLQVLGYSDEPLSAVGTGTRYTMLGRGLVDNGATVLQRSTKSFEVGFVNFFGPRKFGFGSFKAFHIGDFLHAENPLERREVEAMLMYFQCVLEEEPTMRQVYENYVRNGDDVEALKEGEKLHPWLPHLHKLVASQVQESEPYRELYDTLVPTHVQNMHSAGPAAVVWNLAASHRVLRWLGGKETGGGDDDGDDEKSAVGKASVFGVVEGDLVLPADGEKVLLNHTFVETKWELQPSLGATPTASEEFDALFGETDGLLTPTTKTGGGGDGEALSPKDGGGGGAQKTCSGERRLLSDEGFSFSSHQPGESTITSTGADRFHYSEGVHGGLVAMTSETALSGCEHTVAEVVIPFGVPSHFNAARDALSTRDGQSPLEEEQLANLLSAAPVSLDYLVAAKALPLSVPPQTLFGYRPLVVVPTKPDVVVLPETAEADSSTRSKGLRLRTEGDVVQYDARSGHRPEGTKPDRRGGGYRGRLPPLDSRGKGLPIGARVPPGLFRHDDRVVRTKYATRSIAAQFSIPSTSYFSSAAREFLLFVHPAGDAKPTANAREDDEDLWSAEPSPTFKESATLTSPPPAGESLRDTAEVGNLLAQPWMETESTIHEALHSGKTTKKVDIGSRGYDRQAAAAARRVLDEDDEPTNPYHHRTAPPTTHSS